MSRRQPAAEPTRSTLAVYFDRGRAIAASVTHPRRDRLKHLDLGLSAQQRHRLVTLLANAIYELVPVAGMEQAAAELPSGAPVTITASPRLGIEATLDAAESLAAHGHDVCPHLAARSIRDRAHLADLVARMRSAGIRKAFVVGGDGEAIGEFRDGLTLLQALAAVGDWFQEIGVPSYPEGHPRIPDGVLLDDLRAKQRYAHTMTTQMSFNPEAVAAWIDRIRQEGVALPIHLGIPGVLRMGRLTKLGARIGVADSIRYLSKNRGLVGRLVRRGSFGPDALLAGLAATLASPTAHVRAIHLFTMNQVAETLEWQRTMMAELGR
jgi:methylenetetrahydrofolate reductase (NADPH)